MRFLVDENLPEDLVHYSQEKGYESIWVHAIMPGSPDREILHRLQTTGEILVTRDIRFANLVLSLITSGVKFGGVVLIREQKMEAIQKAWIYFLSPPKLLGGFVVLTEKRIRRHQID